MHPQVTSQQLFIGLQYEDLEITLTKKPQPKPDNEKLVFGHHFTDHMLTIDWSASKGWSKPMIHPVEEMKIHPAAKVLHYAVEVRDFVVVVRMNLVSTLCLN